MQLITQNKQLYDGFIDEVKLKQSFIDQQLANYKLQQSLMYYPTTESVDPFKLKYQDAKKYFLQTKNKYKQVEVQDNKGVEQQQQGAKNHEVSKLAVDQAEEAIKRIKLQEQTFNYKKGDVQFISKSLVNNELITFNKLKGPHQELYKIQDFFQQMLYIEKQKHEIKLLIKNRLKECIKQFDPKEQPQKQQQEYDNTDLKYILNKQLEQKSQQSKHLQGQLLGNFQGSLQQQSQCQNIPQQQRMSQSQHSKFKTCEFNQKKISLDPIYFSQSQMPQPTVQGYDTIFPKQQQGQVASNIEKLRLSQPQLSASASKAKNLDLNEIKKNYKEKNFYIYKPQSQAIISPINLLDFDRQSDKTNYTSVYTQHSQDDTRLETYQANVLTPHSTQLNFASSISNSNQKCPLSLKQQSLSTRHSYFRKKPSKLFLVHDLKRYDTQP